jgi:hypothetical protein
VAGKEGLATHLGVGTVVMACALDEIVRLDWRWFCAHPGRRHRCRWPDTVELDLCSSERGAWLVMAMRHLGRGHIVYQPAIFQGALPRNERSAAALFALASKSSEPVPVITQMDVLRLRRWSGTHKNGRSPATSGSGRTKQASAAPGAAA